MPLVHIQMASGRTDAQKRAVMEAITDAVVDELGAPVDSVSVWITEFETTEYMGGRELLADTRARQGRT